MRRGQDRGGETRSCDPPDFAVDKQNAERDVAWGVGEQSRECCSKEKNFRSVATNRGCEEPESVGDESEHSGFRRAQNRVDGIYPRQSVSYDSGVKVHPSKATTWERHNSSCYEIFLGDDAEPPCVRFGTPTARSRQRWDNVKVNYHAKTLLEMGQHSVTEIRPPAVRSRKRLKAKGNRQKPGSNQHVARHRLSFSSTSPSSHLGT
ncbi:hypothetical protein K438DRAFT_1762908 [Mycena galopus ATCC 62051]|nr:hypothetical protein K438DRAFT_1762908 [Mycena galopus ATCC 62051]